MVLGKTRVLFLCTQNSARSQMAEAFLRTHGGDHFEAYSAGCAAGTVDISDQYPKDVREYMGMMHFGYVITVCARAERECPGVFPGMGHKLTWLFDDPRSPKDPEEQQLEKFREVRDQIEAKILGWLEHPKWEIEKLKAQRENERQERMRLPRRESETPMASESFFKRV